MFLKAHTTAKTQKRQVRVLKSKYSRYSLSGGTRKDVIRAHNAATSITAFVFAKDIIFSIKKPSLFSRISIAPQNKKINTFDKESLTKIHLFVIIFHKSKSLIPCIITHSLVNSLSIFNIDNVVSLYFGSIFLIILPVIYAIYINKTIKDLLYFFVVDCQPLTVFIVFTKAVL